MEKTKVENEKISWKLLAPYRIISAIFCFFALAVIVPALGKPLNAGILMYAAYLILSGLVVYGFWKMRKWILILMSVILFFSIVNGGIRVLQGSQSVGLALIPVVFMGIVFAFTYFSRRHLNGRYADTAVLGAFIAILILSKIVFIFLR